MDIHGKRLRLLYPDIHGLERGKYLFGEVAEAGVSAFCVGVYPLTHDKEILSVPRTQFDVGLHDVEATLDRDSLRQGWEENTLVGIADVASHGQPAPWDSRHVLREAVGRGARWGWSPRWRTSWSSTCSNRTPADGDPSPCRRTASTGPACRSTPRERSTRSSNAALECGFPVESWGSEFDNAAYEVNIKYDDAIPAADEAFLFKLLVREICERHGKMATFLGRPLGDRGGSGLHVNFSFRRQDGSNAFHDPNDPEGLSDLARHSIAGLLKHHEGMAAILAPHVNAYKRLQPDMLNGYWANWGHDDRSVAVRIPPARGGATRIEQRTADAAANPYLAGAAVLARGPAGRGTGAGAAAAAAGRRGTEHRLVHPAEPERRARRAGGGRGAGRGDRSRDRGGVHDPEASRVGAIPGGGRRPGQHRGHTMGDRLLPALPLMRRMMRTTWVAFAVALVSCAAAAGPPPAAGPAPASVPPPRTTTAPSPQHIVVIVFENKEADAIMAPRSSARTFRSLARPTSVTLTRLFAIRHPSLPNYLALTSGSTHGVTSDCSTCLIDDVNLVDQLEGASISWKAYMESMPEACSTVPVDGRYVMKHDPFMYYTDVRDDPARCAKVVPLRQLTSDLAADALPTFAWISPNLCHDMHDCSIATGDRFLRTWIDGSRPRSGADGIDHHVVR